MKQKDLVTIIMCVVVSGIFSYLVCNSLLVSSEKKQRSAEVVTPITSEFKLPDSKIFNTDAINPTMLIEIGPNTNNQPFAN